MTIEQALKKISDFVVRHEGGINFDLTGEIWFMGQMYTLKEFAAKIKKDNPRVLLEELVAGVRHLINVGDGSQLDELLKESESFLAQATEPNG